MSDPNDSNDDNPTAREVDDSEQNQNHSATTQETRPDARGPSDELTESGSALTSGSELTVREFSCPQCSQHLQTNIRSTVAPSGNPKRCEDIPFTLSESSQGHDEFILCPSCGSAQVDMFSAGPSTKTDPRNSQTFQNDRYRFGSVIGRGSYGVVYEAYDNDLRRNVAIKAARGELAGSEAELFLREARAASRLRHTNIVTIHDILKTPEGVFIVSDLIRGDSLKLWLDQHQPDQSSCVALVIKICRAMDYAHRNGVIHRDLKPGNIMMDQTGEPHVLDFGLSQSVDNSMETLAQDGVPIGTPAFMAPEQVRGSSKDIDRRSDVFAIGVILFQMLTGRLPFVGNRDSLYQQILSGAPAEFPKAAKVPKSLEAICLKSLAKNPCDRYQWASEMADDLQRFLNGEMVQAHGKIDRRVLKNMTRRWFLASASFLLLVAVCGAAIWIYRDYESKNPLSRCRVNTIPAGGQLTWTRFDPDSGLLLVETRQESIGGDDIYLAPGFYKVIAASDKDTVDVFRTVPGKETISNIRELYFGKQVALPHRDWARHEGRFELPDIEIVPLAKINQEMTFHAAGEVSIPDADSVLPRFDGRTQNVGSFLLASNEISWKQLKNTWPDLAIPEDVDGDHPVDSIQWDLAVAFAESQGLSLPSVWELRYAATNSGTSKFPCGDSLPEDADETFQVGAVSSWDHTNSKPPVSGLLTGVAEWTCDPYRILTIDKGMLVPIAAAHPSIAKVQDSAFPSYWYAVGHRESKGIGFWSVEQSLESFSRASVIEDKRKIGFRTIRRLDR